MSSGGLPSQRWLDPVDRFVKMHGRERNRWAIACTFELDLATLQRSVLPALSRRGAAFRTVVMCDAGTLERKLPELRIPLSGAVNLHGVRLRGRGIFHPKLLLLRAGPHTRVCFGSANLTSGGLAGNLELWSHSDDCDVIAGVVRFFDQLLESKAVQVSPSCSRSIRRALLGLERRAVADVWSTFDGSFGKRLAAGREARARHAFVVSPLYAGRGGLAAARKQIPTRTITYCTDAPVEVPAGVVRTLRRDPRSLLADDKDLPPDVLHAKAYAFAMTGGSGLVWSGSANFSAPALVKAVDAGGNVEILVRAEIPKDEWKRLSHDLGSEEGMFASAAGQPAAVPRPVQSSPAPMATVTGAELASSPAGACLLISSTKRSGVVTLEYEGRTVHVAIQRGRGRLEGAALRAFLPAAFLTNGTATCFAITEVVEGRKVAVPVNVSHVPPSAEDGGSGQHGLDAIADDILGRVRVFRAPPEDDGEDNSDDDEDDDDMEDAEGRSRPSQRRDEDEELTRRLDECKHQGLLDRSATTLAVLVKLLRRIPKEERRYWAAEIVASARTTVPPHLHAAMLPMFKEERR